MRRFLAALLFGWFLGIGTGLAFVSLSGGWYTYEAWSQLSREQRDRFLSGQTACEPFIVMAEGGWVRCPRFVLGRSGL